MFSSNNFVFIILLCPAFVLKIILLLYVYLDTFENEKERNEFECRLVLKMLRRKPHQMRRLPIYWGENLFEWWDFLSIEEIAYLLRGKPLQMMGLPRNLSPRLNNTTYTLTAVNPTRSQIKKIGQSDQFLNKNSLIAVFFKIKKNKLSHWTKKK